MFLLMMQETGGEGGRREGGVYCFSSAFKDLIWHIIVCAPIPLHYDVFYEDSVVIHLIVCNEHHIQKDVFQAYF